MSVGGAEGTGGVREERKTRAGGAWDDESEGSMGTGGERGDHKDRNQREGSVGT